MPNRLITDRRPLTAPQLFAGYSPQGEEVCFYCGGRCEQTQAAHDVVRSTFTALDSVTGSRWVCPGCSEAMREGIELELIDGTRKQNQKTRSYSWIITATARQACTKAHRRELLAACSDPPEPPLVICLSDSGQKHLLYRGVVNYTRDPLTVTLEGEPISFRPAELLARLELSMQVAAVVGKPSLCGPLAASAQMSIIEHYGSEAVLATWQAVFAAPLTRLAAWFCPPQQECRDEYPEIA